MWLFGAGLMMGWFGAGLGVFGADNLGLTYFFKSWSG